MKVRKLVVIGLLLMTALMLGLFVALDRPQAPTPEVPQKTQVSIRYNLGDVSDLSGVTLTLDGDKIDALSNPMVEAGSHTLLASKPGFLDFSTTFNANDSPITLFITLSTQSDSTIRGLNNIPEIQDVSALKLQANRIEYFYDKTWAVVFIDSKVTDPSVVVVRYHAPSNTWRVVLGPGTDFTGLDSLLTPDDVTKFLISERLMPLRYIQ